MRLTPLVGCAVVALSAFSANAHAGNDVLYYRGHNGYPYVSDFGTYAFDAVVGECNDVQISATLPADLSTYRLVVLMSPRSAFSTAEVAQFADFTASGGVLVIAKDAAHYGNRGNVNALASALGVSSYFAALPDWTYYDPGCGHHGTVGTAHALNDGASSIGYGWSGDAVRAGAGVEVYTGESGQGLVVVEGNIVLVSDMDPFISDCNAIRAENRPFIDNLYAYATNGNCDEDGDGVERESCGGVDCSDCDTTVTGGEIWYADVDGDGYGDPTEPLEACDAPGDYVANADDCNDYDADANPDGTEVCDGLDNDCANGIDDGVGDLWYEDADEDGFGDASASVQACEQPTGYVADATDCDATTDAVYPGNPEICDGLDNDCANGIDDGVGDLWYEDADEDGFGDASASVQSCAQPAGYVADATDCDATTDAVYPGNPEICDGLDNDCANGIDDGVGDLWYEDADEDGFGDASASVQACEQPAGYVADATDCDDTTADVNPGALETCNGIDDDCDSIVPDDETDADGDLYFVCENDCDDDDAAVYPDAPELCDGVDNGCTGTIPDEDIDADGDGYSICDGDCDDTDADRYPDAAEQINGIDDDCDDELLADELDEDEDGFLADEDCDDSDDSVNPDAEEVCGDGIDNDCTDGDEACPVTGDTDIADDVSEGCSCDSGPSGASGVLLTALGLLGLRRRAA